MRVARHLTIALANVNRTGSEVKSPASAENSMDPNGGKAKAMPERRKQFGQAGIGKMFQSPLGGSVLHRRFRFRGTGLPILQAQNDVFDPLNGRVGIPAAVPIEVVALRSHFEG